MEIVFIVFDLTISKERDTNRIGGRRDIKGNLIYMLSISLPCYNNSQNAEEIKIFTTVCLNLLWEK